MRIIFSPSAFEDQHGGLFYPIAQGLTELPDEVAEKAIVKYAPMGVAYADLTQIAAGRAAGWQPPSELVSPAEEV